MICKECGQEFSTRKCSCGWIPKGHSEHPERRSFVSAKTGIRWWLCEWRISPGLYCEMPCRAGGGEDGLGPHRCRWHEEHREAIDQLTNREVFGAWLSHMNSHYSSKGWWGWTAEYLWKLVNGQGTIFGSV